MKRRFEFRLARLQRVRRIEERVARATWARSQRDALEAEELQSHLRERLRAAEDGLRTEVGAHLDARRQIIDGQVVAGMRRSLASQAERVLTLRSQSERLLEAWRTRERDLKALTRLEERKRASFARELEKSDARELEERALGRRGRGSASGVPTGMPMEPGVPDPDRPKS